MSGHLTASTSREAFRNLTTVTEQHEAILAYLHSIAPDSSCIADIAAALGWERSTVSARLNELKHTDALIYDGKKRSHRTQIMAMHWKVPVQGTLFGFKPMHR